MAKARPSATGSGDDGYTLVELLVVLTVIGLLLLAVPALVSAGFPGVQAKAAAQQLAADLRGARTAAILNGVEARVQIDATGQRYTIQPRGVVRDLPFGMSLALVRPRRGTVLTFYPDGSSSGGSVRIGAPRHLHTVTDHALTGRIAVDE
jgi:general secretion pathway protein H